jgi:copper chaperone CopZ
VESKTVKVPNIGCDGCVKAIQGEVSEINGVVSVEGDPNTQVVVVQWESPADWATIREKMTEIEYAPADA